jgi:GntR family transcriptional regulator
MAPISRRSNWPLYLQIADDLREQILSETLRPGQRLPSEHSLMEAYGAARQTVRKAIAELKSEGLLDSEQGRGVFVRSRAAIVRSADELLSAARWGSGSPSDRSADAADGDPMVEVKVTQAPASVDVAARLGERKGKRVLVRRERTFDSERTLEVSTTYLPLDLVRGTAVEGEDISGQAVYAHLERLGHRLERFTERVATRMPRPAEARTLDLGPGTPIILIARTAWTSDGRPVAVSDEIMAADRYELRYEIPTRDRMRLVTTFDELSTAMIKVVLEARECLVAVGSRSREVRYLESIEEALREWPRLVHYRLLIGPPHHQVLKDHLLRLLKIRDPDSRDREYGSQTLFMGMVDDPVREPERFFVASERAAVVVVPSTTTVGNFDTGIVFERPGDARGLVQHAKTLYAGTQRLEDLDAVQQLSVLR